MMRVTTARLVCSLILWVTVQGVSAQDWRDMGCLAPEQQQKLLAISREMIAEEKIYVHVAELQSVRAQMDSMRPIADDCVKRQNDIFEMIGATLDGCKATFQRYNSLNAHAVSITKSIDDSQRIILGQLNIERSLLPTCR